MPSTNFGIPSPAVTAQSSFTVTLTSVLMPDRTLRTTVLSNFGLVVISLNRNGSSLATKVLSRLQTVSLVFFLPIHHLSMPPRLDRTLNM